MLCGEVSRREVHIGRLTAEVRQFEQKIASLDAAMALFEPRLNPEAAGIVRGTRERYGKRGGLAQFILEQVKEAGDAGVDTVTLTVRAAAKFGVHIAAREDLSRYRDSITWILRNLRRKGTIENKTVSRGGHTPSTWRMKRTTSLQALAAQAKALQGARDG